MVKPSSHRYFLRSHARAISAFGQPVKMVGLRPLELARLPPASRRRIYDIERRQKKTGNNTSRKGSGTREPDANEVATTGAAHWLHRFFVTHPALQIPCQWGRKLDVKQIHGRQTSIRRSSRGCSIFRRTSGFHHQILMDCCGVARFVITPHSIGELLTIFVRLSTVEQHSRDHLVGCFRQIGLESCGYSFLVWSINTPYSRFGYLPCPLNMCS